MTTTSDRPRVSTIGYAVGIGVTVMAILGSVAHFAFPNAPDWAMFVGGFLLGATIGAWRARSVGLRHGEPA